MGFISHHITPLVIYSIGDVHTDTDTDADTRTQTHTQTHRHTHIHMNMHTDDPHSINFKKSGTC